MPARTLDLDRIWTLEEVLALPDDGNRYELVDGELLVSPSPRPLHQTAVLRLAPVLDRYVLEHRLGCVFASPADLDLRSGQRVQPDIFVADRVDGGRVGEWTDVGIPLLVVEVLSPGTADYDRVKKRRRYQRSGVPRYWIVDLDARQVEVWTPTATAPAIETKRLTWHPDAAAGPLEIDLPALFDSIQGVP
jgi:Uma2 family endonuclease